MHRLAAALDQEDQQIEIARDERQLVSVAEEQPLSRRDDEFAEAITGHEPAQPIARDGSSKNFDASAALGVYTVTSEEDGMARARLPRVLARSTAMLAAPLIAGVAIVAQSPAPGDVTFAKDIAPILQRSCQQCHHADGVAPMPLVDV